MQIHKLWTEEENSQLKELVLSANYSFNNIAKLMNRTKESCKSHAKTLNVYNKYIFTKYTVDENFWETPNPINSYFGGFSSADSTISKEKTYHLAIQKSDQKWLQQFKDIVRYTGRIYHKIDLRDNTETVTVSITNRKWIKDLAYNFSVIPQKTYRLVPPRIRGGYLELCWLLGMTDGDGTVCLTKLKNGSKMLEIGYTSSSLKVLEYIKYLVDKNVSQEFTLKKGRTSKIHKIPNYNCYQYIVSGSRAIFLFQLLKNLPVPKMDRKWVRPEIEGFIKERRLVYPEFFKNLDDFHPLQNSISQLPSQSVINPEELNKEKAI